MPPEVRSAVVLCTHDGARHVRDLLDSIAAQTCAIDELHVFDWNSSDETLQIVEMWQLERGFRAAAVHRMSTAPGPAASFIEAMLRVADSSRAELLLLADQDDTWTPAKVATILAAYRSEQFDLAHSDVRVVYESSHRVDPSFYGCGGPFERARHDPLHAVLLTNPAIGMTMAIRREWLQQVRAPLGGLYWVMHDWALAILCWLDAGRLRYIDEPLVNYRQHESNILGASAHKPLASKLRSRRSHVANVRRQLCSAAAAAQLLGSAPAMATTVARLHSRVASAATLARARVLTPRYRVLLGVSFLLR